MVYKSARTFVKEGKIGGVIHNWGGNATKALQRKHVVHCSCPILDSMDAVKDAYRQVSFKDNVSGTSYCNHLAQECACHKFSVSISTDVLYYMDPLEVQTALLNQGFPVHFAAVHDFNDSEIFPDENGVCEARATYDGDVVSYSVMGGGTYQHSVPKWIYAGGINLGQYTLVVELYRSAFYMSVYKIFIMRGSIPLVPQCSVRVSQLWDRSGEPVRLKHKLEILIQHSWSPEVHTTARHRIAAYAESAGYLPHDERLSNWVIERSNSFIRSLCDKYSMDIFTAREKAGISYEEVLAKSNTTEVRNWRPWLEFKTTQFKIWSQTNIKWYHLLGGGLLMYLAWRSNTKTQLKLPFGKMVSKCREFWDELVLSLDYYARMSVGFAGDCKRWICALHPREIWNTSVVNLGRALDTAKDGALRLLAKVNDGAWRLLAKVYPNRFTNFLIQDILRKPINAAKYLGASALAFLTRLKKFRNKPLSFPTLALVGMSVGFGYWWFRRRSSVTKPDVVLKGQCLGELWKTMPVDPKAKSVIKVHGECNILKPRATLIGYGVEKFKPFYFASCDHNQAASVCSRILNPKPPVDLATIASVKEMFYHATFKQVAGVYNERQRISRSQFLQAFPLGRRKILEFAARSHLVAPQPPKHYHSSNVFVKVEPYLKDKVPMPRSIQDKNPAYLMAVGPTVATLQKALTSTFSVDDLLFIASGSNFEQMGAWVSWYVDAGWEVYENDFSRFDSTISVPLLHAQFDLYKTAGCPPHVVNLLRKQTMTIGRNKTGTIKYKVPGTVQSGVSNTSIGGSLMNMMMLYYSFGRLVDDPETDLAIMVLGDDSIICTRKRVSISLVEEALAKCGMISNVVLRPNPFDIEMCSSVLTPTSEGRVFMPKLGRILAKTFYTTSSVLHKKHGKRILVDATCDSLINCSGVLPIIPKIIGRLRSDKPSEIEIYNQYTARCEQPHKRCPETEQFFLHRYGMSVEMLDSFELPEPGLIDHPMIDAVVERDLGIRATCSQLQIVDWTHTYFESVIVAPIVEETVKHILPHPVDRCVIGLFFGYLEGMLCGADSEEMWFRMVAHATLAMLPLNVAVFFHSGWNALCMRDPEEIRLELSLFMANRKSKSNKKKGLKKPNKKNRNGGTRGYNTALSAVPSKRVGIPQKMTLQSLKPPLLKGPRDDLARYALSQIDPFRGRGAKIPDRLPNKSTALQVVATIPFTADNTWVNMTFCPCASEAYWIRNDAKGVDEFLPPDTALPAYAQLVDLYSQYRLVSFAVKVQFTGALSNAPGVILCRAQTPASVIPTVAEMVSRANADSAVEGCLFTYRKYSPIEDEYRGIADVFTHAQDGLLLMRIANITAGASYIVQMVYNFELLPRLQMEPLLPVEISPVAPMQRAAIDNYVASLPQSANLQNVIKYGAATPDSGKKAAALETVTKGAGEKFLGKLGSGIGAVLDWLF